MSEFELVTLKSGIKSLRSVTNLEVFHPFTGPVAEAQALHVDQQKLVERSYFFEPLIIWDIGLGAAANALTAIASLKPTQRKVEVFSFDITAKPLEFATRHASELGYPVGYESNLLELIAKNQTQVSSEISWKFILGDFRETLADASILSPHAILYDPYSPGSGRDMWRLEHFTKLYQRLDPKVSTLLTNYTCSTAVRTTLLLAGFYVGQGFGVGKKLQTTVASNDLSLIDVPLDRSWLRRVRVSHASAPMVEGCESPQPISEADWLTLNSLPQFQ